MDINFDITLKHLEHLLKYVKVSTFSENVYEGWLKDIDPLSGHLILVNFQDTDSTNESATLIQAHDCKSVEVMKEDENMKNSIQHFFNKEGVKRLSSSPEGDIDHKNRLISWFRKNRLEVEETEDSIVVCKSVTIHPPYTIENCVSSNGRVLVMTKNLISSMPGTLKNVVDSDISKEEDA